KLVRLLQQHQVHLMQAAPVVLQLLVDHLETLPPSERALPDLEWMMAIAEAAPVPLLNQWLALNPQIPIMNGYGPSEASDDITEYVIRTPLPANTPSVPIGRPIPNLTMYVLDKGLQLQPIGVPGELCVSGVGVGKGYWNKPERTASSFVVNPY
ncbi:AMP-binding protein, partial [Vibrio azureus]